MVLELFKNEYSIYKFTPDFIITENIFSSDFISITKTKDEISIVAPINKLKNFIEAEIGWKIIKINEILDFSLIGIISKISTLLANENISIFVISTYNTDYILVKKENLKKTIEVLIKNQYEVKY